MRRELGAVALAALVSAVLAGAGGPAAAISGTGTTSPCPTTQNGLTVGCTRVPPSVKGAELIQNGSFSSYSGNSITGWTVLPLDSSAASCSGFQRQAVPLVSTAEHSMMLTNGAGQHVGWIPVAGTGGNPVLHVRDGAQASAAGVSQTVTGLVPGATYVLQFKARGLPLEFGDYNRVTVLLNGSGRWVAPSHQIPNTVALSNDPYDAHYTGIMPFYMTFVASGTSASIAFRGSSIRSPGPCGAVNYILDDVSLRMVGASDPETPVVTDPEVPVVTDPETPVVTDPETPVVTDPEDPTVTEPVRRGTLNRSVTGGAAGAGGRFLGSGRSAPVLQYRQVEQGNASGSLVDSSNIRP